MNIAQLSFKEFIAAIIHNIIQPVIILIFALAILYFLWNITQFIRNSDKPDELEKFKKNTLWGIVAISVMASVWGLVQILINSFVPGSSLPVFDSGSASFNSNQYSEPIGPPRGVNFNFDSSKTNYPIYNSSGFQGWTNNTNIGGGVSPRYVPPTAGTYQTPVQQSNNVAPTLEYPR